MKWAAVQMSSLPNLVAGDLSFMSPGFLATGQHRLVLYRAILGYNVDIICSDVDTGKPYSQLLIFIVMSTQSTTDLYCGVFSAFCV